MNEPVVLVGETGAGKTATIQYLAKTFKKDLKVVNLSKGTDSADLFGGFKPMNLGNFFQILLDDYSLLLENHKFASKNLNFFVSLINAFQNKNYLIIAKVIFKSLIGMNTNKKISHNSSLYLSIHQRAEWFLTHHQDLLSGKPMFDFTKGVLWKALETGEWVLLDEINLAQNEVLERLEQVLKNKEIFLLDSNQIRKVTKHQEFRVFAAMNPAHEVGKKALPKRLEKLFVNVEFDAIKDKQQVLEIIKNYFRRFHQVNEKMMNQLADFYVTIRVSCICISLICRANQKNRN
jgi:midasin